MPGIYRILRRFHIFGDGDAAPISLSDGPPRHPEVGLAATILRSGDRGDDLDKLKPFANAPTNWVNYHQILAYLEPLQGMMTEDPEVFAA